MKRNKLFTVVIFSLLMFPLNVLANETSITSEEQLKTCFQTENSICKLTSNIILESALESSTAITLDLNGYTLTSKNTGYTDDSLITVLRGSTLTINDSSKEKIGTIDAEEVMVGVKITKKGEVNEMISANLIVNDAIIKSANFAISGNGLRHNTNITINGGTFIGNSTAIYHPQKGSLTINNGTFVGGESGIEMRSGNLIVNDGTITGNGVPSGSKPNYNGTTTIGAGIAIAQHSTELETSTIINGGTIKAYTPVYQSDPQNNIENDITNANKVILSIINGNFVVINNGQIGSIYSENKTAFITGGTFSDDITKYVKTGYEVKSSEQNYIVTKIINETTIPTLNSNQNDSTDKEVKIGIVDNSEKTENILLESFDISNVDKSEKVEVILEVGMLDEKNIEEKTIKDMEKAVGNAQITSYFDITVAVRKFDDKTLIGTLPKLTEEIELTIMLPDELKNTKENVNRIYYIIRNHIEENKVKIEKLEATVSKDGKYLTFKTDKFSTYALAYEDKINEKQLPPKTYDGINLTFITLMLSFGILTIVSTFINKNKIFN